jgi:hypothetical protein
MEEKLQNMFIFWIRYLTLFSFPTLQTLKISSSKSSGLAIAFSEVSLLKLSYEIFNWLSSYFQSRSIVFSDCDEVPRRTQIGDDIRDEMILLHFSYEIFGRFIEFRRREALFC